jgi:hypothetical protein
VLPSRSSVSYRLHHGCGIRQTSSQVLMLLPLQSSALDIPIFEQRFPSYWTSTLRFQASSHKQYRMSYFKMPHCRRFLGTMCFDLRFILFSRPCFMFHVPRSGLGQASVLSMPKLLETHSMKKSPSCWNGMVGTNHHG